MYRFIMRALGVLLLFLIALGLVLFFGPRQTIDSDAFVAALSPIEIENAAVEFSDSSVASKIKDGQQKQILWAGDEGQKTEHAVLYVHGFSASLQEIRPVPDLVAKNLGANLVFMRLTGHGLPGDEMAKTHVNDWMADMAQAISVARAIGDKVIMITTSTGGTLASAVLPFPDATQDIAGIVFISPNFAVMNPAANLAKLPFFDKWGPMIAGETRSFEPRNAGQETYWTTSYPTRSVVPMMRLIDFVEDVDFAQTNIPALFYFSDDDQVVDASVTRQIINKWGGSKKVKNPILSANDDRYAHVIAGDIMSPSQTLPASQAITDWVQSLQ